MSGDRHLDTSVPVSSLNSGTQFQGLHNGFSWTLPVRPAVYFNFLLTLNLKRTDNGLLNSAPQTVTDPVVVFEESCAEDFVIPWMDRDKDDVRCRWSIPGTQECAPQSPPSAECRGSDDSIFILQQDCTLQYSGSNPPGNIWFIISGQMQDYYSPSDPDSAFISSVPFKFIVNLANTGGCQGKPRFVDPTPSEQACSVAAAVGDSVSGTIAAEVSGAGVAIRIFQTLSPGEFSCPNCYTPVQSGPLQFQADFQWTPTANSVVPNLVCFRAVDSNNKRSQLRCLQLCDDHCASGPCINGQCTSQMNGFTCTCDPGWTGTICDQNIDECASIPCMNGGMCNDMVNSYTCSCLPGWAGTHCEINIDECASTPCMNGGMCNDMVNGYTCDCLPGWTGTHCQTNINECASNPCMNGGTCNDMVNGYTCDCQPGWTGTHCDMDIDECASDPCVNGFCTDEVNGYFCTCDFPWIGTHCDQHYCERELNLPPPTPLRDICEAVSRPTVSCLPTLDHCGTCHNSRMIGHTIKKRIRVRTLQACCQACHDTPGCVAFNWRPAPSLPAGSRTKCPLQCRTRCILKSRFDGTLQEMSDYVFGGTFLDKGPFRNHVIL